MIKLFQTIITWLTSLFGSKTSSVKSETSSESNTTPSTDNENTDIEESDSIMNLNNSENSDYHKQTNNEIDPFISCFPTSMINAGEDMHVKFPTEEEKTHGYVQEEDQYNWYLENNPECRAFWGKEKYKSYLSDPENHPRELYEVEEFSFNNWIGKTVCEYIPKLTLEKIVDVLSKKGVVVTSGKFCGFSHVVCVVGFNGTKDNVKEFIVDDSYGNPHNNYKPSGVGGNDVVWNKDEFLAKINKGTTASPSYCGIVFEV